MGFDVGKFAGAAGSLTPAGAASQVAGELMKGGHAQSGDQTLGPLRTGGVHISSLPKELIWGGLALGALAIFLLLRKR